MPYAPRETPTTVKNLPAGAQAIFRKCFNAIWRETKDETKARIGGWRCVKNEYTRKSEGHWVSKP